MPKFCTICSTPRPVLIRCQIDKSQKWHFVCPGACWKSVSGGMEDAKGFKDEFPHYRYGGMWKDRSADGPVSAKKPKKVKDRQRAQMKARDESAEKSVGDEVEGGEEGKSEDGDALFAS